MLLVHWIDKQVKARLLTFDVRDSQLKELQVWSMQEGNLLRDRKKAVDVTRPEESMQSYKFVGQEQKQYKC